MTQEVKDKITSIIARLEPLRETKEITEAYLREAGFSTDRYQGTPEWDADRAKWIYKVALRNVFQEAVGELFRMTHNLKMFTWYQYSSYYDDSSYFEASFMVWHYSLTINQERVKFRDWSYSEQRDDVRWFLQQFKESDLLHLFGDHVEVCVRPDGATIRPYIDEEVTIYSSAD